MAALFLLAALLRGGGGARDSWPSGYVAALQRRRAGARRQPNLAVPGAADGGGGVRPGDGPVRPELRRWRQVGASVHGPTMGWEASRAKRLRQGGPRGGSSKHDRATAALQQWMDARTILLTTTILRRHGTMARVIMLDALTIQGRESRRQIYRLTSSGGGGGHTSNHSWINQAPEYSINQAPESLATVHT